MGLDYLTLSRAPPALSGRGASASQLRLVRVWSGVLYVLDEPSIGLHQRDNRRLIDPDQAARYGAFHLVWLSGRRHRETDWIVDIGPGASRRRKSCTPAALRGC